MSAPLLEVADLRVEIDADTGVVRPVDGVSFAIAPGETFALLGESGCGKSMSALALMRLLPDAARIVAGAVRLGERALLPLTEREMRAVRGAEMAMIFQEPATSLNPVLTVGAQIMEVLEHHRALPAPQARARALELLDAVGIPDAAARLDEYPFRLSGGMKQRAMIAMALACEPALLIADEPTTALDVTIQAQVLTLLRGLQRSRGMAMLLITHDLGVVAQMAQRVAVMYAGVLVEQAPRERFFAAPCHPYSRKLFDAVPRPELRGVRLATIEGTVPALSRAFRGCRFAERCPQVWERCRREAPAWRTVGEDHQVRCHLFDPAEHARVAPARPEPLAKAASDGGEALLGVRALQVHFPIRRGVLKRTVGHVRAVDGVSLDIAAGSTLALVGESGCGKTTVGKAVLRLVEPTGGEVHYAGRDLLRLPDAALRPLRREIQMVFQDPYASLNPRMRVGEVIAEGITALGVARTPVEVDARVAALLQQVGLSPEMTGRYPHEFSGGQRQRIAIARALAVGPRLIVCDEPTSALDVSVQAQILNLLESLQAELGLAYLFITHNLGVVDYLADHVAVMYLGRIVERGTTEEILRTPRHPYTRALLAAVPQLDGKTGATSLTVGGDLPSPVNPPAGCHFHPRCPQARPDCRAAYPEETRLSDTHTVRCVLYRN